ncbi:putative quinol monooxygenase [Trichococcus shcherbakoviae]|uniref:putative quinol monooxygenase n=1 Tax=Trichococcus shcherbakoviae TaxID=2094020 RepID=UPI002AA73123|nr:putative quinol monooxygenase [Trichococcus shcherbakoviae]
MIVINAEFYIIPEQKQQFLNEISELIKESRKEEGCLSYQIYQAVTDENNFVMVEKWENPQAIELHNTMSHLQNFAKKVPNYSRKAPQITVSLVKD